MGIDDLFVIVVVRISLLFIKRIGQQVLLQVVLGLELQSGLLVEHLKSILARVGLVTMPQWRAWIPSNRSSEGRSGIVYLAGNEELWALKIGVASEGSERVEDHERHGWTLLASWGFRHLTDALIAEELVLDRWRNLYGQPPVVSRSRMPQGGHTETMRWTKAAEREIFEVVSTFWSEREGVRRGSIDEVA